MRDYIIRAVTDDGSVRAFGCISKNTVDTAREFHSLSPVASAALGRLLTAAVIMGSMLKGERDLITLQLTGGGPLGRVVAVSGSDFSVKGYVDNPNIDMELNSKGKLDVGRAVGTDGFLTVITDLGLKEPYIGKIPLVSGEVGDDIAKYYAVSEQVPSVVALGVLVDRDLSIKNAGGMIIQVMPEAKEEDISRLEENIKNITSVTSMLESGMNAEEIIKVALDGFDFHFTEKHEISYKCGCTRERVRKVLKSIGAKEIENIINEDGKAELCCQFCPEKYEFDKEELENILNELKTGDD
ncbi:MAG: Hsp33 family molecular chaperone HslO [Clostridia bacterium]|nr:Hsp33 family molecular chaperone HslO [Clostridia bacterium]